jgi:hypothetical protein
LKIKKDFMLKIPDYQVDKDGTKVEPEQMLAERAIDVEGPMRGSIDGQVKGNLATEVVYTDTVGQFAQGIRRPCATCAFFQNPAWRRYYQSIERGDDPVDKKWLNGVRAALLGTQNASFHDQHQGQDGELDVEHALSSLGICPVYTELLNPPGQPIDPIIVHPMGVCPEQDPRGNQLPVLYKPATREQGRAGDEAYDEIMYAAKKAQSK